MWRIHWEILAAGWAVAALWWVARGWLEKRHAQRLRTVIHPRQQGPLLDHLDPRRRRIKRALELAALLLLALALAQPQTAFSKRKMKGEGVDTLFCVDVSQSMLATDVFPNRLQRAKRALWQLVESLKNNRIGILEYSAVPFVTCPFTKDTGALKLVIDGLGPENLPVPGTDLRAALLKAFETFQRTGARHQALVVVGDGENFGPKIYTEIKDAFKRGVRLYALGIGSKAGAAVPLAAAAPAAKAGVAPTTRLNEKLLREIAYLGGGRYFTLKDLGQEEAELIAEINRLEKTELVAEAFLNWTDLYPLALTLAVLLMLAEMLIGSQRGPRLDWQFWRLSKKHLAVLLALSGWALSSRGEAASAHGLLKQGSEAMQRSNYERAAQALQHARKLDPDSALIDYQLGCVELYRHKYQEAYQAFSRAARKAKGDLASAAWYNLGYTAFYVGMDEGRSDYWLEAAEAYKQVLLLTPRDDDARYNLELILREILRRTKQASRRQEQGGGQPGTGKADGSDAQRPGGDPLQQSGKSNPDQKPKDSPDQTTQPNEQGEQQNTSDSRPGNKQQGMSKDSALRALQTLQADENTVKQNNREQHREVEYNGPPW